MFHGVRTKQLNFHCYIDIGMKSYVPLRHQLHHSVKEEKLKIKTKMVPGLGNASGARSYVTLPVIYLSYEGHIVIQ